jgi:hypothetical protein
MSLINSIYDYILTCPILKEYNGYVILNVDYSNGEEVTTYSINETVCNPIVKEYVNGNSENQFLFTISSVEPFGGDADVNADNITFYEKLSKWLKDNNKQKIFPTMEEGQTPTSIKALTGGYLFDNQQDMTKARYCIQCKLIYDQKN